MARFRDLTLRTYVFTMLIILIGFEIFIQTSQFYKNVVKSSTLQDKTSGIKCEFVLRSDSLETSNQKTRVIFIFGTRPELIKMAPVIQAFERSKQFIVINVFTGQHPDMIQPFLLLFEIKVDIFIRNTMQAGQSLSSLVSNVMKAIEVCLTFRQSDIWMVQGDTSTAFAVSTVAFNHKLRIGHIEAGLRTYDMYSPFPEEFNRKSIANIATFHFAPTEKSKNNLISEGIPSNRIYMTGNTVIDAVKILNKRLPADLPEMISNKIEKQNTVILITMHRRENFEVMDDFYTAIESVPCSHCRFIVPVHPNPNAAKPAMAICVRDPVRFICVPPLSYQDLHLVMKRSHFILTDSGGLQEEATWYHKPILVLRKDTERTEAIDAGVAVLIGRNYEKLKELITQLLDKSSPAFIKMSKNVFPFGFGNSSQQILNVVLSRQSNSFQSLSIKLTAPQRDTKLSKLDLEAVLDYSPVDFNKTTVAVILQVFKRNTLASQLECAKRQTLKPKTIAVFQNGFHVDVTKIIKDFRINNPDIELQHFASSKNARFHGRFHFAYMMSEEYVSVWDDDMSPRADWLRFCIDYSKKHRGALVGANGRTFLSYDTDSNMMIQKDYIGRNDFVGHTWTLQRRLLKYYIEFEPLSLHTGEDIQLSFALQKVGIESHSPFKSGATSAVDMHVFTTDEHASWTKDQSPRQLLFCRVIKAGFKPIRCNNCDDKTVIDSCIDRYESKALSVEKLSQQIDSNDNKKIAWMSSPDDNNGTDLVRENKLHQNVTVRYL